MTLRGHIESGNLPVDEGVDLPEGTKLGLTLVDEGDESDEFDDS